ncbi:hypothetical protein ACRALDRAFT_1063980 [Sodiomyces alcalophilus JCM 7366]|uniref:uncharacterized protein n=1 Tax=Sodiomyces alcalophilus JCM 7366 TaxID=591952 RepID=UPI0039B4BDBD
MADHDAGAIFGFDESSMGVLPAFDDSAFDDVKTVPSASGPDNTTVPTAPTDASNNPDHRQLLYDPSYWAYQEPPSSDTFNFSLPVSTAASPAPPLFPSAPWEFPPPQHQPQPQQQPQQQQPSDNQKQLESPSSVAGLEQPATSAADFFPNPVALPTTTTTTTTTSLPARQVPTPQPSTESTGSRPVDLTPAQQENLRNIAMPAHLQYQSPRSEPSPGSATSEAKGSAATARSTPDAPESRKTNRKRKSSADGSDEDEEQSTPQPVKKTAHNMIEKRYRTNLNDKIAALRDSVPSLRIMSKSARGEDTTEDREELHGLTPAHKLNKATVLSKAAEYIRHLEKRNNRLRDENNAMHARIAAFEKLFMAGAMTGAMTGAMAGNMNPTMSPMQQAPTPMQYPQDQYMATPPLGTSRPESAQGLIQVPDDMKRILSAQMAVGQPYPVPQQSFRPGDPEMLRQQQVQQQQQSQQNGRWNNVGPYFGKLMVGSLAGLMVLEAVRTEEQSNETPQGRGLFALPVHLLRHFGPGSHFHVAGHAVPVARLLSHLKLVLFFGVVLYVFLPSVFFPSEKKDKKRLQQANGSLQAVPSLASPIHIRRRAWLTAIQTVWVPEHNLLLEAAALIIKTLKLSLRNAVGMDRYQSLTGFTEEQETARVKAWTIALDAQLAGGDVEINKFRLALTLLASGTLPDTPLRLMLEALHIRVLLWDFGPMGLHNVIAARLARSRWNEAKRRLRDHMRQAPDSRPVEDDLPEHLAALLDHDCGDVLNDSVIQCAYNLAWNLPTTENVNGIADGMDTVVDDHAVRSPMDAVAAWWSCQNVQRALWAHLGAEKHDAVARETVEGLVREAIRAAPAGSAAQGRALVARAVLFDHGRDESKASDSGMACPTGSPQQLVNDAASLLLDSYSDTKMAPDFGVALGCSAAISKMQRPETAASFREMVQFVEETVQPSVMADMSLLGCTALFRLMDELHSHPEAFETFGTTLECLAGSIRIWIGSAPGEKSGLDQEVRHKMVDRCLSITKSLVGMEADTGYGSMSECEDDDGC